MANIKLSGFSLAKGKELKGDDAFLLKQVGDLSIAVLCDGVGSADHGAEAAKRVCAFLVNSLKNRPLSWSLQKSILHFIKNINSILYTESMESYEREELVTTLALAVIVGDKLYGANVGDSRIYLLRDENLSLLSTDHSFDDELGGALTQAIGISESVEAYYFENIISKDDNILLCSDGLYNILNDEILARNIINGAHHLVKMASKDRGDNLPDDTTAVVIDVKETDQFCLLKEAKLDIPESLKTGENIDGYKLIKSLIQNDRTWLASQSGKEYVIKFAPYEALEDERILDLYVKEAWNAKRLKAGYFPKAVIPKNRTSRYYIMQMIDGDELKDYLKKRLLSIDEGVNLAIFLLHMNQFLLSNDLVHGDIKPENIIRAQRKGKTYYKMIDFGSIVEIFSISSRAGTPSYLAPERFVGENINEASEIFAIGVTLYEALTGKLPYGEIEPFQTPSFKKPKNPTLINPKIPKWLESIILRAICKEQDCRYKNYSEMVYELENPQNVKPFYDKSISLIEREPVLVYKIGFILMLIVNIFLIFKLLS
jgi:serine/threonine protein phosphatase PrpC